MAAMVAVLAQDEVARSLPVRPDPQTRAAAAGAADVLITHPYWEDLGAGVEAHSMRLLLLPLRPMLTLSVRVGPSAITAQMAFPAAQAELAAFGLKNIMGVEYG
jgi:hypothetical protein